MRRRRRTRRRLGSPRKRRGLGRRWIKEPTNNLGGKRISLKGKELRAGTKDMFISLTEETTFGTLGDSKQGKGSKLGGREISDRLSSERLII